MTEHRIFTMKFSSVYPAYVNKATRKQRTQQEVDQITCWLTGYTAAGLKRQLTREVDIRTFFPPQRYRSLSTSVSPASSTFQSCGLRGPVASAW